MRGLYILITSVQRRLCWVLNPTFIQWIGKRGLMKSAIKDKQFSILKKCRSKFEVIPTKTLTRRDIKACWRVSTSLFLLPRTGSYHSIWNKFVVILLQFNTDSSVVFFDRISKTFEAIC